MLSFFYLYNNLITFIFFKYIVKRLNGSKELQGNKAQSAVSIGRKNLSMVTEVQRTDTIFKEKGRYDVPQGHLFTFSTNIAGALHLNFAILILMRLTYIVN